MARNADEGINKIVGLIVISIFLQRPQKRSRENQLIHRLLTRTKSIGSGQGPESQAGRQRVRRLWWMVFGIETGREVGWKEWIRIGFATEQCFYLPPLTCPSCYLVCQLGTAKCVFLSHWEYFLLELDQLQIYPIVPIADCQNSWWWGRLWVLPIVYWNAFSVKRVGRSVNYKG